MAALPPRVMSETVGGRGPLGGLGRLLTRQNAGRLERQVGHRVVQVKGIAQELDGCCPKQNPPQAGLAKTPGAAGWVGAVKIHGTGVSVFRYGVTVACNRGASGTGVGPGRGNTMSEQRQGLIYKGLAGRLWE